VIFIIVFTRRTHTNFYLHSESHHHPFNILAVLSALSHTARPLCDNESLHDELEFLKTTFRKNDCSIKQISCALNPAVRTSKPTDKPTSFALHRYVQTTYGRLSRILAKRNMKCAGLQPSQISSFLRSVMDELGLKTPRVYSIPCECG
jgi:hypothetical protein